MPSCLWCSVVFPGRSDAKTCSRKCRQAIWRFWKGLPVAPCPGPNDTPMTFAYADPPYPGCAGYYPEKQEIDHGSLLEGLQKDFPDGWALSTSARALRDVLRLCPRSARVAVWIKGPRPTRSARPLNAWEPVIVSGGRRLATDVVQDVEDVLLARGRFRAYPGALIGMKPPAFCAWLFQMMGVSRYDRLVDLFPGSGAVSRAFRIYVGADRNLELSFRDPAADATSAADT